jgi:cellulose biosynthesis protein BcsQ
LESGDVMVTILWYRSQTTIKIVKAYMAEASESLRRSYELMVRSNPAGFDQMFAAGEVDMILVEVDQARLEEEVYMIQDLRKRHPEVRWVALLHKDCVNLEFILSNFHEFIWFGEVESDTLAQVMTKTRDLYDRREALGLPGLIDLHRGAEIERLLSEQEQVCVGDVNALTRGLEAAEKKRMHFKFGSYWRLAEKEDSFNAFRMKLSVVGNSEYGCELGWVLSKNHQKKTLILDADRLQPSVDLLLNVKRTISDPVGGLEELQQTGLNLLLDAIRKNCLTGDKFLRSCARVKGNDYLFALTGSYNLSDYEYYDKNDYMRLIEKAGEYFDVVILLVNRFIYDAFTTISLLMSDKNLLPVSASVLEMRSIAASAAFVSERQRLDPGKNYFVAFDVDERSLMTDEDYEALSGNRFLGSVPSQHKRCKARYEGKLYGPAMERQVVDSHEKIIKRLISEMRC